MLKKQKNYKLKIKDNIDLKELEKFGFVFDTDDGIYKYIERSNLGTTSIKIKSWNKRILYKQDVSTDTVCLCVLYDLIKADLIEKAGVKNGQN